MRITWYTSIAVVSAVDMVTLGCSWDMLLWSSQLGCWSLIPSSQPLSWPLSPCPDVHSCSVSFFQSQKDRTESCSHSVRALISYQSCHSQPNTKHKLDSIGQPMKLRMLVILVVCLLYPDCIRLQKWVLGGNLLWAVPFKHESYRVNTNVNIKQRLFVH